MRMLTLRGLLVGILALVSPALLGAQPVVNRCGDTVPVEQRTGPMVVIVPGIDRSSKDWRDMLEYFRSDRSLGIADSPFYCFDHGVGAMSRRNLRDLSRDLAASVESGGCCGPTLRPDLVARSLARMGTSGGRLVSALEGGYAPSRVGEGCVVHMRALVDAA